MAVSPRWRSRPLNLGHRSGEAGSRQETEEIDDARSDEATAEPEVPEAIARLGVEARAEYLRARERLGLSGGSTVLGHMGRYHLEEEIGRGGMGVVYRARDPKLDRPIAIKLVQADPFAHYDKLRARLLREAKVLAKLNHSNVVAVHDCGQHEGEVYLAMEYVEGTTLREWQRGQGRRAILGAYVQAARGLAAAHEQGIVHRDFKPDNVLVASDGRVLVGDFGLAGLPAGDEIRADAVPEARTVRPYDDDDSGRIRGATTRTGTLLGTLTYMAPEQLRGEVATSHCDQFAFCVALWEALTGGRPFAGDDPEVLLAQIARGRIRGAKRLPRRLRAKLLRGLSERAEDRFGEVGELADALEPWWSWRVAAAIVVSVGVGIVVGWQLFADSSPSAECERLRESIAEVDTMPEWEELRATLEAVEPAGAYQRLQGYTFLLDRERQEFCRPGTNEADAAGRQSIGRKVAILHTGLGAASPEDVSPLFNAIRELEEERWIAPPPRPLVKEVNELIEHMQSHVVENELDDALGTAELIVNVAGTRDLELAYAHRWRGRILALNGDHAEAMDAYQKAIVHAESVSLDDARLDIELLVAKTAVMRLEEPERARYALSHAEGLLQVLDEPWFSQRRADYHEVLASVLKRDGDIDEALLRQRCALILRYLGLNARKIGVGHTNLGAIFEQRGAAGDAKRARRSYERAVEVLSSWESPEEPDKPSRESPEWAEAALGLGHWLANAEFQGGQLAEKDLHRAEELLTEAKDKSDDLRVFALTDLVMLAFATEADEKALDWAKELDDALRVPHFVSREKRLDALSAVAVGKALGSDLAAFENARTRVQHNIELAFEDRLGHDPEAKRDDLDKQLEKLDATVADVLDETAPLKEPIEERTLEP